MISKFLNRDLLVNFLHQKGFDIAEVSHLSSDQYDALK